MKKIFLGIDIGSSTSHALLANEEGQILSFAEAGPGNHEVVGYDGLHDVLNQMISEALQSAGVGIEEIIGAGFGVSGYDWPSERSSTLEVIRRLGLSASIELVNDTLLGLFAGATEGWGIVILAGSGENCWGRDPHGKIGRMTGLGPLMGEYGGAFSVAAKAIQAVSAEWSMRGPATSLAQLLMEEAGALDINDLVEGLCMDRYHLSGKLAPKIFQAAERGDSVALQIVGWAAEQLAGMVTGVVHQLDFQQETFEVVEMGGVFQAGAVLTDPFRAAVHEQAPGACFVPLEVPPVVGAVILATEQTDVDQRRMREQLIRQADQF
jgi:N-acetylglucosamine kinase-like BadF-type ATPase